jgi:hypothetical protein
MPKQAFHIQAIGRYLGSIMRPECSPNPRARSRGLSRQLHASCSRSACKSAGRIRMEFTTHTCGNSPRSHRRYTVALHTPRCSATSATRSSRSRPPQSTRRSASVGAALAIGALFSPPLAPCAAGPVPAPPWASVAPESGSKWVAKLFVFAAKGWGGWTDPPSPSVVFSQTCEGSGPTATVGSPFRDRKVGGSNPLAPTTQLREDPFQFFLRGSRVHGRSGGWAPNGYQTEPQGAARCHGCPSLTALLLEQPGGVDLSLPAVALRQGLHHLRRVVAADLAEERPLPLPT